MNHPPAKKAEINFNKRREGLGRMAVSERLMGLQVGGACGGSFRAGF